VRRTRGGATAAGRTVGRSVPRICRQRPGDGSATQCSHHSGLTLLTLLTLLRLLTLLALLPRRPPPPTRVLLPPLSRTPTLDALLARSLALSFPCATVTVVPQCHILTILFQQSPDTVSHVHLHAGSRFTPLHSTHCSTWKGASRTRTKTKMSAWPTVRPHCCCLRLARVSQFPFTTRVPQSLLIGASPF
jgi:hypothetical protein